MCHIFDKNYKLPKDLKLDLGGFDSAMKEIEINLDKIAQDIRERKDNAIAMEFTRVIVELLKKNGVVPKITEVRTGGTFDKDRNVIEERYGVLIDGLDFYEHDNQFKERIGFLTRKNEALFDEKQELMKHISEIENNLTYMLPSQPIAVANYLIHNTCTITELEQIAEHLLIYCKHNK